MRNRASMGVLLAAAAGLGCGGEQPASVESPPGTEPVAALRAREVAAGLVAPVYLVSPPGDGRLFVVEQPGRIRIIRDGELLAQPFLDIAANVGYGGERGLLGLAFDPAYATSGTFYVNYTDRSGATRVERYRVSGSSADRADPASASAVLTVPQLAANHNGGMVEFGPDGMLYVGMGDGGGAGDPGNHGQNPRTLLGALLRLDVRAAQPYAIPADNPFRTGAGGAPEVWAYGLRNPWRFTFDAPTGMLWIADVGQNRVEEINAQPYGTPALNYGWNVMEGSSCYQQGCSTAGKVLPVHEYDHGQGCSITGGFVYRGTVLRGLQGHYFYADYCRGWVRSLLLEDGRATAHRDWSLNGLGQVLSFGRDAAGELYVLSSNGRVYRLEPAA